MDAIVVRCKTCKHAMKFSIQKVGKRAKCPKCDAVVLIQADAEKKEDPEKKEEAPPAPKPEEDEFSADVGEYGVAIDPELEELAKQRAADEEAKLKKKKERQNLPKLNRKVKAIPDAESWQKVRIGMLFVSIGIWVWLFCHLLQGSYILFGSVEVSEFANMIGANMEERRDEGFPELGNGWDVDRLNIFLGMIAGRDFLNYANGCLVIASLFYFVQAFLWIIGYCFCLPAPRRFGMFPQIVTALVLAFFNMLAVFIFKLLPALEAHGYIMVPFVVPEIALTEYNMERMVPIHVLWSAAPFWENFATLLFRSMQYFEPAFFCIFVWSAGKTIKDETVASGGHGRTQMCLGTLFVLICYHLLSLCGASPVLVIVLRVIYALWYFFTIFFMLQYAMLLTKARAVLYDKINPKNELE